MQISAALALALFNTFYPLSLQIRDRIRQSRGGDPNYQPTNAEMQTEFQNNMDAILAEGDAWRAAHPNA